jgi:hypothetical protein
VIPNDTSEIAVSKEVRRYVNRLTLGVSDNRALFPYSVNFTADQGKEFVRAGLTAKYFFNYPDGKTGMSARFFAGKFIYMKERTLNAKFETYRYHLNMSAPNGYEDYTYSDYFVGRNDLKDGEASR